MPTSDCYSLDKRLISRSRWVETIRGRILHVRALERPEPLPLGIYTDLGALGRQRGLQRALAPYGPVSVRTHAHARARDSTHSRVCREALSVLRIICLDRECVSKATNWWENTIVSIWRGVGFRVWGPFVGAVRKRCR